MPPKVKITEDAIVEASIQLIRERGIEGFNARDLAKNLNCSTQPIFWKFKTIDDLKKVVHKKVDEIYNEHMINGLKKAIIISSAIFGVMHAGNIVGGADIFYTCIQIVFAFAFGIVFVEIFYFTKSLIPVIIWHFLHDCLTYIENTPTTQTTIILGGIQTLMLVIYAVYMWRKIDKKCNMAVEL